MRENCETLADDTNQLEKELDQLKTSSSSDLGSKLEAIGYKIFDLVERILAVANELEEVGETLFRNGERLKDRGKLTFEINKMLHSQGETFESVAGKIKDVGSMVQNVSNKMGDFGKRLKNKDCLDLGLKLNDFSGKIKVKGEDVEELSIKLQELVANGYVPVSDNGYVQDIEEVQRALGDVGNDLGFMLKVLNCNNCFVICIEWIILKITTEQMGSTLLLILY